MTDDAFDEEVHQLTFYAKRCIRYHMRREAFFAKLNKLNSFLGVVFGSAAIATLLKDQQSLTLASAGLVTVFSALDLVVGTGNRSTLHGDLRKRFLSIETRLQAPGLTPTDLSTLRLEMRSIEAEEPPALAFLNEMASNEVIRSMYPADEAKTLLADLPWRKRVTANFIDWDVSPYIGN